MTRRAVFLDRDGTLVEPRHYPSRPEDLVLWRGMGPRLRALLWAGFRLVVITNQSGIARGLFTEADLRRMHDHLANKLAREGVTLAGIYHCPHHPDDGCECRKPAPGMLLRAAADLDLDLAASWFIGDILDDVEAGNRAGCRTVLVDLGTETLPTAPVRVPSYVARDTAHALDLIAAVEGTGPAVTLTYSPTSWSNHAEPADDRKREARHAVVG